MKPAFLIIAAGRPELHAQALQNPTAFGVAGDVQVILDRRVADRRGPHRPFDTESRRNDRRRIVIDVPLRSQGWAIVTAEARQAIPPHTALHIDLGMGDLHPTAD